MNGCQHRHNCFDCGKPFWCDFPECQTLEGRQRLCSKCGYIYGWARTKDKESNDWSAL